MEKRSKNGIHFDGGTGKVPRGSEEYFDKGMLKGVCVGDLRKGRVSLEDTEIGSRTGMGGGSLPKRISQLGSYHILNMVEIERIVTAAMNLGVAQGAFEDALEYAKRRVQFGQPIGKFQVIQHMLAEMATRIDAARLLTYRAGWLIGRLRLRWRKPIQQMFVCGSLSTRCRLWRGTASPWTGICKGISGMRDLVPLLGARLKFSGISLPRIWAYKKISNY